MSPRAACRLEALGFSQLKDYVAGKADWLARNLPIEGEQSALSTAGRLLRTDIVTCAPGDPVSGLRARIDASPYGFALVTTRAGVLLGRIRRTGLTEETGARVDEIMEPGPSTVRPHTAAEELHRRLEHRNLKTAIVTNPDGELLGVVLRHALQASPSARE